MDIFHSFDCVIFYDETVFHGNLESSTLGLMERVRDALEWLKKTDKPIFLVTQSDPAEIAKTLEHFALTDIFTHDGQSAVIQSHQHENGAIRALPDMMWGLRPAQQPQWQPIGRVNT